ncbi:hypothetical protein [uncultured Selenomonas sp.]|uniref:hypothetical protein n=1 Tax=uncultured Selenomonas sp. TaxID=159275 RepID=UPI0028DCCEF4|nr:hypothetical protein [uncultured Selenomonas sp.]
MKKIDFTTTLRTGEVLRGTAEYDREYWLYSPYDYARVQLTGTKSQLYFSRDLVSPLGAQGALSRSENLLVDTLDEQGRAVERQFADLSGGRPHCVDLDAAGEWGEVVRRALEAVEAAE